MDKEILDAFVSEMLSKVSEFIGSQWQKWFKNLTMCHLRCTKVCRS
jgi:hypothetical protein